MKTTRQQITTNKSNRRKNAKKPINTAKTYIFYTITIILLAAASFSILSAFKLYKSGGVAISKSLKEINVSIEKGSTLKTIATNLKSAGIIKSEIFFKLKCKELGVWQDFQYGDFTFTKAMDFDEIVANLKMPNKSKDYVTLLIKEGDTQEDIAKNIENLGVATYAEFINACNDLQFDFDFLQNLPNREQRLEGYLYPDTYYIGKNETPKDIIKRLLSRFEELFTKDLREAAKKSNLSTDEVVTIASIIEKEIKIPSEREIAASVIFNRLRQNIKLQIDATVLYALGHKKDRLFYSDLETPSDYNTYYISGLPKGPICSPSIESIKAVLNPAKTDYIYYVVKNRSTGEHFFTADYNEFLDYKEKYVTKFN